MAHDAFKAKLARVEALRALDDPGALLVGVRKALADQNNYVAAKAAAVAAQRYVCDAVADLLTAYDRFFGDPVERDPLVTAKVALAQALKDLDHRDPAPFVRGLTHVQLEPVWGRLEDRAGPLRAICAHALVACEMDGLERLELLVDRLADDDAQVRREVVRAIGQLGGYEAVLLLRLKVLAGDDPEVLGACFTVLLDLEPRAGVAFVQRFLSARNGAVKVEAVAALAAARTLEAFAVVRRHFDVASPEMCRAIVYSCAASPLREAAEFLLAIAGGERADLAAEAFTALAASRFRGEMREAARAAAQRAGGAERLAGYERAFGKRA